MCVVPAFQSLKRADVSTAGHNPRLLLLLVRSDAAVLRTQLLCGRPGWRHVRSSPTAALPPSTSVSSRSCSLQQSKLISARAFQLPLHVTLIMRRPRSYTNTALMCLADVPGNFAWTVMADRLGNRRSLLLVRHCLCLCFYCLRG